MKCPYCGAQTDRVVETRAQKSGEVIRRRRECLQCKNRFSTQESLIVLLPTVIKKDGRTETFSREKILHGIRAACQKRPVTKSKIESIAESVSNWVLKNGHTEIPASQIGNRVLGELKEVDHVAYVRFASVHRTFSNLDEFLKKLDGEGLEL